MHCARKSASYQKMILGNLVLAVIPARGGSKSIKLKNLMKFKKQPLVAHVGQVIRRCPWIDYSVVSTDHKIIAKVALRSGVNGLIRRPKKLSGDFVGDNVVLRHAVQTLEKKIQKKFQIILMLQPTSPLRTPTLLRSAVVKMVRDKADSVWTVTQASLKFHPEKALIVKNGNLQYFSPSGKKILARQQLQTTYIRNGLVYGITRNCLFRQTHLLGKRCSIIISKGHVLNIDDRQEVLDYLQKK